MVPFFLWSTADATFFPDVERAKSHIRRQRSVSPNPDEGDLVSGGPIAGRCVRCRRGEVNYVGKKIEIYINSILVT